jgi:2'-5' RNA ligase
MRAIRKETSSSYKNGANDQGMTGKKVVAFWLVPAQPEKQLFSALINILARELKAPLFEPHVTLFISEITLLDAERILKTLQSAPILLRVYRVNCSARFSKTLFVRFRGNRRLNALQKEFSHNAGRRIPKPADPHLSLCYKSLPASARRELASIITLPFKTVRFDVVKSVQTVLPIKSARDVRAWWAIGARHLRA